MADIRHEVSDLLIEYQCAQDSAQHHDALVWTSINTLLGASLILFGFVINDLRDVAGQRIVIVMLSLLGILIDIFVFMCVESMAKLKGFKYKRCKEIEAVFGFKQHTEVKWKARYQRNALNILLGCFIFAWMVIIIKTFLPSLP
jgi:hypothetical protein